MSGSELEKTSSHLSFPHRSLYSTRLPTHHIRRISETSAMEAVVQLKRFGTVCPFLHRTPLQRLGAFSTQGHPAVGTNHLVHLAQSRCPLMRPALRARGFATTSPALIKTNTRSYASVTEVQQEALRKATNVTESVDQPFVNEASVDPSSAAKRAHDQGHHEGRPTCALGFKKHIQHSPIFNYEGFYEAQLQKKHEDRSYRVRRFPLLRSPSSRLTSRSSGRTVLQQHQQGESPSD